jgi:hypothetical protein
MNKMKSQGIFGGEENVGCHIPPKNYLRGYGNVRKAI